MAARQMENNAEFRKLWMSDKTITEIADHYGIKNGCSVSKAAKRFGLPARSPGNRALGAGKVTLKSGAKRDADEARAAAQAEAEARRAEGLVPRLQARGISPDSAQDMALGLVRARAYADLDAVATRHAVPLQRLLPFWHEVRA